jgi:hypothetical protein
MGGVKVWDIRAKMVKSAATGNRLLLKRLLKVQGVFALEFILEK